MRNVINTIALAAVLLLPLSALQAQEGKSSTGKAHRVVFEVTGEGAELWTSVLNNVENVRTSLGDATAVEVVVHGKALGLLVAKDNPVAENARRRRRGVRRVREHHEKEERHEGSAPPICADDRFRGCGSCPEAERRMELHQERPLAAGPNHASLTSIKHQR